MNAQISFFPIAPLGIELVAEMTELLGNGVITYLQSEYAGFSDRSWGIGL